MVPCVAWGHIVNEFIVFAAYCVWFLFASVCVSLVPIILASIQPCACFRAVENLIAPVDVAHGKASEQPGDVDAV